MLHSCSHDKIALAAVACIGGPFEDRVRAAALLRGLDVGWFVGGIVRRYALSATELEMARLRRLVSGADQPILCGLRYVVEQALRRPSPQSRPVWIARMMRRRGCERRHLEQIRINPARIRQRRRNWRIRWERIRRGARRSCPIGRLLSARPPCAGAP